MKPYQRALIAGVVVAGLAGAKYLMDDEKTIPLADMEEICDCMDNDCDTQFDSETPYDENDTPYDPETLYDEKSQGYLRFSWPDPSKSIPADELPKLIEDLLNKVLAIEHKRKYGKYEGTL